MYDPDKKKNEDFEIFDELTSVVEVLEEPEENLMLVACGCTVQTQRADSQIC